MAGGTGTPLPPTGYTDSSSSLGMPDSLGTTVVCRPVARCLGSRVPSGLGAGLSAGCLRGVRRVSGQYGAGQYIYGF